MRTVWNLPLRALRKARQGPEAFGASLAHYLWRRGPLYQVRRAWALRTLRPPDADRGPARGSGIPALVSVVLPVFDQADLLAESIDSVLGQTYPHVELIVIDDGSTDDVASVLARYLGDPRVRILSQANQTLPKALSNGFDLARGEFWTWTSADNRLHPDQLARLVEFLAAHPAAAMVYADYLAIDDRGEPLRDPSFRPSNRNPADSPEIHLPRDPRQINVVRDNFIGPCFLYRNIVGRLIGDYDPAQGIEDYDYWMRVNHAFRVEHLGTDETLYSYRVHDRSLSGRAAELRITERVDALMRTERARSRFYREPWTLFASAAMRQRFVSASNRPHRWLDLEAESPALETTASATDKVLILPDSTRLDDLPEPISHGTTLVAAWFATIDEAYERRVAAARLRAVGLSDRPGVAERLDLLGVANLVADSPDAVLDLAIRYANNRVFFGRSRPESTRHRVLPEPFPFPTPRHLMLQVDDFFQGGLENVVLDLARGLRARGHRVSLLILGRCGPAAEQARADGITVATIPAAAPSHREAAYRALLREQDVNLVHAHYSTFGATIAADLAIPFVQVVHNAYVWLDDPAIDAYRAADAATTAYLCVSAEAARYCDRRMGLSVDKMIIVPNGVNLTRLDAARSENPGGLRDELGLEPGDFVLLNVASIHATKAQTVLVRAMADVVREHPGARLVLAGSASDAGYEHRLRRRIVELGLEGSVVLAGHRPDVARFHAMADAFVLPSYWEGWSLALTEAACVGLPLIASDVGGARDLIAYAGGRLIRPPFATIADVDPGTIPRLLRDEHPRFVADLASAMRATVEDGPMPLDRGASTGVIRRLFDRERMIDVHHRIVGWLLQGGHPAAARVWARLDPPPARTSVTTAPAAPSSAASAAPSRRTRPAERSLR